VEKKTGQMMSGRIEAIELAIEHVRKPCQGVLVGGMKSVESPGKACFRQSLLDMAIISNV